MSVTLTNNARQPFTVTLYHDIYCAGSGDCKCVSTLIKSPKDDGKGNVSFAKEARLDPASIRLEGNKHPGKFLSGLHDAVLQIPQIKIARKSRQIKVTLTPTQAVVNSRPVQKSAPVLRQEAPDESAPDSFEEVGSRSRRRSKAKNRS